MREDVDGFFEFEALALLVGIRLIVVVGERDDA